MIRKSSPSGAAPYSAALISLSVPSTPTRRTRTSTPRPSGTSPTDGFGTSSRWIEPASPGVTAIALTQRLSRLSGLRYGRRVGPALSEETLPEHPRWPGHWAVKPEAWPEDALLAAETRDRLTEAIEALPATQRAVISLRDVEGWSSEEVRNALDLSETNQRVLLHRARSKVRAALEGYLKEAGT